MIFPDYTRVIYDRNPLRQVICQLRFPAILRISSETPAQFQELIRNEYPLYEQKTEVPIIAQEIRDQFPPDISNAMLRLDPVRAYEFSSEDKKWVLSLTRDFLALTSLGYEKWENFKLHLNMPIPALTNVYKPPFFTRIGLRYQDVIRRSKLGLENIAWSELLEPYIASELMSPHIAPSVDEAMRIIIVNLDVGKVRIQHGLVTDTDIDTGTKEVCYLIDSDFFLEPKVEVDNVVDILDYFNAENGRLFHWCVTDRLRNAMAS